MSLSNMATLGFADGHPSGELITERYMTRTKATVLAAGLLSAIGLAIAVDTHNVEHLSPQTPAYGLNPKQQVAMRYTGEHFRQNGHEFYGSDCLASDVRPPINWTETGMPQQSVQVPTTTGGLLHFNVENGMARPSDAATTAFLRAHNCMV